MKNFLLALLMVFAVILAGCDGKTQETESPIIPNSPVTTINPDMQDNTQTPASQETGQDIPVQVNTKEYVQPKMEGEITISTMFELEYMTAAANQFTSKYPDVKVVINAYSDGTGQISTENYRNYLNTKIMTGKAEDLIFTGNLPVKKYTDMGVFEDFSYFLSTAPEFNSENYFMNVLESPRDKEGKLYVVPLMCFFPVVNFDDQLVLGNSDVLDGIGSIGFEKASTYGKQLIDSTDKKNAYLSRGGWYEYLKYMMQDDFGFFIDTDNKKANLNSERYIALLCQTKDLSDNGYWASDGSINFYNMEYHFAIAVDFLPVQAAFYNLDPNSRTCYSLPLADVNGNVYINPNNSIGINSASKNKELAWEFVKFLLSDEIQSLPSFNTAGFGVNKKGFNTSIDKNYSFYSEKNKGVDKEAYKSLLEQWVMQINAYDTLDPVIEDILKEENSKFMDGKQSAEETARVLQSKIDKYFNE